MYRIYKRWLIDVIVFLRKINKISLIKNYQPFFFLFEKYCYNFINKNKKYNLNQNTYLNKLIIKFYKLKLPTFMIK